MNTLRNFDIEVVPIDVRSSRDKFIVDSVALPLTAIGLARRGIHAGLDRERRVAQQSMLLSRARSRAGRELLEHHGAVDGIIQIGTGYDLGHPNTISYEDMTIPQALDWPETFWGDVPRRMVRPRVRQQSFAYQRQRGAAFCTSWAAESAVAQLGCPPDKAHVVGIGANFLTARRLERDWSTPRFFFAGREWSRKNGPMVLEAFAEVQRAFPQAELHLAGHHPRIEQPGVIDHGHLDLSDLDDRAEMLDLWQTSTCCVVPSRFEPAGIIYVEAMHAGIPSIGTRNGGAADIIGDAGVAVDPSDLDELTRAMLAYSDPVVAATVGARAQRRSAEYTWERVTTALLGALGSSRVGVPETDEDHLQ
ncbi:glycosyltransferase family 4 protein [Microbacterium sp. MMO-10]|uniref:glycosyltransferase family 4 protein n=1 Tax=Microbacterium sp. MMO-10 TaxID=3081272 RepID=UPI003015CCB6